MCGFSGIINLEGIYQAEHLLKSLKAVKHRGVDDTLISNGINIFSSNLSSNFSQKKYPKLDSNNNSPIWFGFNRLSIVDLSENAMQPFVNKSKDVWFMLVGEIYNYKALRKEHLAEKELKSDSDSEVAFQLYLKYGDSFIELLRGMFSIVIIDTKYKLVKAWRDRFGVKPFYYTMHEKTILFSSEINGILDTGLLKKEINNQGLAYSMYLGTCPAPLTIYNKVNTLEAGKKLTFNYDTNEITTKAYWTLTYNKSSKEISTDELASDIKEVINLSLTGDVKKALMLSGGIDSGVLAYFIGKSDTTIEARSLHMSNSLNDEKNETISNAENAKTELAFYEKNKLTNQEIIAALEAEEEPNESIEPAWILTQFAQKEKIKVLYNALGPDELFGGYAYYSEVKKLEKIIKLIPSFILSGKKKDKLKNIKKFGLESYPFIKNNLFDWKDICEQLHAEFEHPILFLLNQAKERYPEFKQMPILKKISWLDFHYYIASHHSLRSDRVSMLHSIEMRFPYLDHVFIEKYFSYSKSFDDIKKNNKPYFRKLASKLLRKDVLKMSKKGFSTLGSFSILETISENKRTTLEKKYFTLLRKVDKKEAKLWYLNHLDKLGFNEKV